MNNNKKTTHTNRIPIIKRKKSRPSKRRKRRPSKRKKRRTKRKAIDRLIKHTKKTNRRTNKMNPMPTTQLGRIRGRIKSQSHKNLKEGLETNSKKVEITKENLISTTVAKETVSTDPIHSNLIENLVILWSLLGITSVISSKAVTKISEGRRALSDLSDSIFQYCKIYYNIDVQERSNPRRAGQAQGSINLSL